MARPRTYDEKSILDASLAAVALRRDDVTIGDIAQRIGAPVGSLYHHYPGGRKEILVRLWIRSIGQFHAGLLPLIRHPDPDHAVTSSVRHVVQFCREHPAEAISLTLFRQEDLVADAPDATRQELAHVNDDLRTAMTDLSRRLWGRTSVRNRGLLAVACQQVPYDLVVPHLGSEIPEWMEDAAVAAAAVVLERARRR